MFNLLFSLQIVSAAQTCNDCLANGSNTQNFWCISTNTCMPLSEINNCENVESHDLLLNASQCCSIETEQDKCLSPKLLSFCLWCPSYVDDDGTTVPGQCMYKSDPANINKNCKTNPDITSMCSSYPDCASCANDVVCGWCPQMGRCVTAILDDMPYPEDQYKCTNASTKICCDSYTDCVTCAQNSGSASDLICTWCQTSPTGEGICQTYDKALNNADCQAINELGVKYCGDTCYMEGKTCKSCIKQSGCVWLDQIQYVVSDAYPVVNQFCTSGGPKGPSKQTVEYDSNMNITYDFTVLKFNYMTCAMSAAAMNGLIIGLVVSVVLLAIIIYIAFIVRRKVKIAKYLKEQAKNSLTQADRDMLTQKYEECEQEFIDKYLQEIPWEDQ